MADPTAHPAEVAPTPAVVADPTAHLAAVVAAGVPTPAMVADPTAHLAAVVAAGVPTPAVVAAPMARPVVGPVDQVAPGAAGLRMQQGRPDRH